MDTKEKTTRATLRIFTEEIDLAFISEALGVRPTEHEIKGDPVDPRKPEGRLREQSRWAFASPLPDTSDMHEHLEYMSKFLQFNHESFDSIRGLFASVDIFCMFSSTSGQGSAWISAQVQQVFASLEVDVVLDLYPPGLDCD